MLKKKDRYTVAVAGAHALPAATSGNPAFNPIERLVLAPIVLV